MCDKIPCRCSCDLHLVTSLEAMWEEDTEPNCRPGRFMFRGCTNGNVTYQQIWVVLPNGKLSALPVNGPGDSVPDGVGRPMWQWDGNLIKPTLRPSILSWHAQAVEAWHGFLTAGRLVSC